MEAQSQTAREYCCAHKGVPFGKYRLAPKGEPGWRKLSGGYIGVTDGSDQQYVMPKMIFAVEVRNGRPAIYSYTRKDLSGAAKWKPYSRNYLHKTLSKPELWEAKEISFGEMVKLIIDVFPEVEIPNPSLFWAEYGMSYDKESGEVTNFAGVKDDE